MINRHLLQLIRSHLGDQQQIPEGYDELLKEISAVYDKLDNIEENEKAGKSPVVSDLSGKQAPGKSFYEPLNPFINPPTVISSEQFLDVSEERFRALIENNYDGIILRDEKFLITYSSRSADRILGYTFEEMAGKTFIDTIHPEDLDKVKRSQWQVLRSPGKPVACTFRTRHSSGNYIWIERIMTNMLYLKNVNAIVSNFRDITERESVTQALSVSQQRYALAKKATNDVIWDWDINTNRIYRSANYKSQFGYAPSAENVYDESWINNIHPDDKEAVLGSMHQKVFDKSEDKWEEEYRFFRSSGELAYLHDVGYIVRDASGRPLRMVGAISDITEKKIAQLNLIESEKRYRLVSENPILGITWKSLDGNIINVNQAFCEMTGYSTHEILNRHFSAFTHPDDCLKDMTAMDNIIQEKTDTYRTEKRFITKQGETIWAELNLVPVKNENGNVSYFIGMIQNINSRRQAEENLRRSEANLRSIFDHTSTAYLLLDTQGKAISFNPPAKLWVKNSLGKDLAEGEECIGLFPVDRHPDLTAKANIILAGKTLCYEASYVQPDGSTKHYEVLLSPVKKDREIIGICTAMTDITGRKQNEQETIKLVDRLQSKNNDLRQFAYIVSHNLRSPIAKISGLTSLFDHAGNTEEETSALIGYIRDEVKNLDNVVKDMNTIITVSDSEQEAKEFVHFEHELSLILKLFENEIRELGATVHFDFRQVHGTVTVKSYLYSIIYNLVSNALKYRSDDRSLELNIESGLHERFITFSVQDNGSGIDLVRHGNKLFGLYKRFHESSIAGKGIGLNMVKVQAESLGGRVEVDSKPGLGTKFTIYLPK
jgi:PAS domain S-box-containing protein